MNKRRNRLKVIFNVYRGAPFLFYNVNSIQSNFVFLDFYESVTFVRPLICPFFSPVNLKSLQMTNIMLMIFIE